MKNMVIVLGDHHYDFVNSHSALVHDMVAKVIGVGVVLSP
jgi:hypothetical protein